MNTLKTLKEDKKKSKFVRELLGKGFEVGTKPFIVELKEEVERQEKYNHLGVVRKG